MTLRIAVDMDGVLVDLMKNFLGHLNKAGFRNKETGAKLKAEDIKGWDTHNHLGIPWHACEMAFNQPGLFGPESPPIPGAIRAMAELCTKHNVYIASSPYLSNPQCEHDKREWLRTYLPFVDQRNVIFTHKKFLLDVDILLDDKPKTIKGFNKTVRKGKAICFAQPWNEGVEPRVSSWEEFLNVVDLHESSFGKSKSFG